MVDMIRKRRTKLANKSNDVQGADLMGKKPTVNLDFQRDTLGYKGIDNHIIPTNTQKKVNMQWTNSIEKQWENGLHNQYKPNHTGMPDKIKSNIEQFSGVSMDDVKVRIDSPEPARRQSHAFTQGTNIYIATGQNRPEVVAHEGWHVAQQKLGWVKPTHREGGLDINDDPRLERDADTMAVKVLRAPSCSGDQSVFGKGLLQPPSSGCSSQNETVQKLGWRKKNEGALESNNPRFRADQNTGNRWQRFLPRFFRRQAAPAAAVPAAAVPAAGVERTAEPNLLSFLEHIANTIELRVYLVHIHSVENLDCLVALMQLYPQRFVPYPAPYPVFQDISALDIYNRYFSRTAPELVNVDHGQREKLIKAISDAQWRSFYIDGDPSTINNDEDVIDAYAMIFDEVERLIQNDNYHTFKQAKKEGILQT